MVHFTPLQRPSVGVFSQFPLPKVAAAFLILFAFVLLAHDLSPHLSSRTPQYYDYSISPSVNSSHLHEAFGGSRLARTLGSNEREYQRMIVNRENLIKWVGGRQIASFPSKQTQFYVLWDFYIPAFSCPFPMYRVGTLADGGKWVCGLERIISNNPRCIVYSLNNNTQSYSSFEQDILERSSKCQVFGFDVSSQGTAPDWPWGQEKHRIDSRLHVHNFGIGDKGRSLRSVMKQLGHKFIDILKVDLEGGEFAALPSILAEWGDQPLPFGQLLVEVHVGWTKDMTTVGDFGAWFERLEQAGLRPFYFEISMTDVNTMRAEPAVGYWSFMNIRGSHALLDDSLPEYP
ncbi:unnamed protein product [Mycena citricolor]|uniref:Methyltransferase domain-containing protein n=1 Tax=Mycena citricolor TaxID=2018698 RepID=A0AAD2JY14_9AGAR|nr:unnamed protein product [Mycena citricolor]